MTPEEYHLRLLAEFDRILGDKPHGTLAWLQREMGVSDTYIRQWRAQGKAPIARLLEALTLLNVDHTTFLVRAFEAKGEFPRIEEEAIVESPQARAAQRIVDEAQE